MDLRFRFARTSPPQAQHFSCLADTGWRVAAGIVFSWFVSFGCGVLSSIVRCTLLEILAMGSNMSKGSVFFAQNRWSCSWLNSITFITLPSGFACRNGAVSLLLSSLCLMRSQDCTEDEDVEKVLFLSVAQQLPFQGLGLVLWFGSRPT